MVSAAQSDNRRRKCVYDNGKAEEKSNAGGDQKSSGLDVSPLIGEIIPCDMTVRILSRAGVLAKSLLLRAPTQPRQLAVVFATIND